MDVTKIQAREIYQIDSELQCQESALKWQSRLDTNMLVCNMDQNAGLVMPLVCMVRDQILSVKWHANVILPVSAVPVGEILFIYYLNLKNQTRKLQINMY